MPRCKNCDCKISQESNAGQGSPHKLLAFGAIALMELAGSLYLSILTEGTI